MRKMFAALAIALVLAPLFAANDTWELIVFFNNDRHGGIASSFATFISPETPPKVNKFAAEFAIVQKYRAFAEQNKLGFLYFDQGDIYQGDPVGSLTKGAAIIAAYNKIMPDAVVPGNHDFDDGSANFSKLVESSRFPWLGSNLVDAGTHNIFKGLKPYIIRDFALPNGSKLKVGIIGLTTSDVKSMSFPENTAAIDILDEASTANAYAETLRAQGCDFVILLAHIGLPFDPWNEYAKLMENPNFAAQGDEAHYAGPNYVTLAAKLKGIDVAFGGHIHLGYAQPWADPTNHTLVFQNYASGTNVGAVKFRFDTNTKTFLGFETLTHADAIITLFANDFWNDTTIAQFIDSLSADAEKNLAEVVGEANGPLMRGEATVNKVGHIMCDAMIEATNSDVAITNMGGVRAELPAGRITRKDVFATMPFDNRIVVVELTGAQILAILERMAGSSNAALVGGVRVTFDPNKPSGSKITSLEIKKAPVDRSATYRFATSDYIFSSYGIEELKLVPDDKVLRTGILMREAIERYIRKHSPIQPDTDGRWKIVE